MNSKIKRTSVLNETGLRFRGRISHRLNRLARQSVAFMVSGLLAFQPVLVQAQSVTPDAAAPAGNRPGVGAAPNGVPLVDIVTPNGAGLSHNKYGNFNVGTPGLILNNHNGEVGTSKLGGVTPGNANLKNSGPATVILNEVTSGNRSSLLGPTEVFGGRADVVIANPNGITCNGCGFINTPRATLTTGTPDLDGSGRLSGFTVRGGDVTFGSKGGNFASGDGAVDLFDIVSRTIRVDGPVSGKNLRLTAGRNTFNYTNGEATALGGADDAGEFAIDGSALGAMQADRIKIVVTDKGAGVRMRADMAANAGELTLSADGRISLGNASGRDGVNIQSKNRKVEARKITSKKKVVVKAAKGITLDAVAADEDVVVGAGDGLLSASGDIASLGNVSLTSSGAIATANVSAGQNVEIDGKQGISAKQVLADGSAGFASTAGNITISGTAKASGGNLVMEAASGAINAASLLSFNNMSLSAGKGILVEDTILSGGALVTASQSFKAGSAVSGVDFAATGTANGSVRLGTAGDMRLRTSAGAIDVTTLLSAGNLNVSGSSIAAQGITSHGSVMLAGNTNVSGQILGAGDVTVAGTNIEAGAVISGVDFTASAASPTGAIVLGKQGGLSLQAQAGTVDIGTLLSASALDVRAGSFDAANVTSHGTATIVGKTAIDGQLIAASDVSVTGSSVQIGTAVAGADMAALESGTIAIGSSAHTLSLTATAGDVVANRLLSSGDITASATGDVAANAVARGDLQVAAKGALSLSDQSLAGGNVNLTADTISLGTLVSGVDFAASEKAGGSMVLKSANAGKMMLDANGGIDAGSLLSAGSLDVKASKITAGNVTSHDSVTIRGMTTINGQLLAVSDVSVTGSAIDIDTVVAGLDPTALKNGTVATGTMPHTLALTATAGDVLAGHLLSSGDIIASATGDITANALARNELRLTAGNNLVLSGQTLAGENASLTAGSISLETLVSGVDFAASERSGNALILKSANDGGGRIDLNAGDTIKAGTLLSGGALDAKAASFKASNVTSHATATIQGATTIDGQLLAASDIAVTGQALTIATAVAGVDLAALDNGNVALADTAHSLTLHATSGSIAVGNLLSSGNLVASAGGNVSANVLAHGDLQLAANGDLTLTGQSLAGGSAVVNANAITLDTLVSGVDFAATDRSGGALILKTGAASVGQMKLTANGGSISADQLLSGGDLAAKARQNITYNSLQSFASADLGATEGVISLDRNTVAKGDVSLTLKSLDLSNDRGKIATAGTLTVNAAAANLSNSTLTFGGFTLNLSGSANASNAKIRAVTGDGGSGDIAITAQTITTTASTALLAGNDLTLTLASLTNPGQLAANGNLTFNIAGDFSNTSTGLVYAGQDGRLYVAGDLLNDQGAILVGNDLTIAANATGGRNQSITNVSGLIKAGRDATITTANLTNKRVTTPTWSTVVVSDNETTPFVINPETWGKPLGHLFTRPESYVPLNLYPGEDPASLEWMAQLYGVVTLADGTSYRTRSLAAYEENTPWNWGDSLHSVGSMENYLREHYPHDSDGNIILTSDLQPNAVIIVNKATAFAWTFTWEDDTRMSQTIHEQKFDTDLSPEALIQTGRNLNVDATVLNNAYSSIEAGGNARLTGSVLNNEGVALYRTVTSTCEARGGCQAYDAEGNPDHVNDLDNGNSRVTSQTITAGAYGNIKAAGNMDVSGFATVNNMSSAGSIAGGAQLSSTPAINDPTAVLNGLTAGGALFAPNAALVDLLASKGLTVSGNDLKAFGVQLDSAQTSANGVSLSAAEIVAALGSMAPKPDSGGFGGTIPGQVFLYETRAEFLDVSKFYGSGYFIDRIGYKPDREVPFLGDAYFENQLVDQQLRQLVNQGLGKGSFIPGSDAVEQMKVLLDRGADYARAHGLTIGEKLSPELISNLTETLVWYEAKTVNGIEVLVPTVYVANTDKSNITVAGAIISGDSVNMNVGEVNNSGVIAAKTDLQLVATNITATGGSFKAGNDLKIAASQNLTLAASSMRIGDETFVKSGSGVDAGGNASLISGDALTLRGADVKVGKDVTLSAQSVTLDVAKATNRGSENVVGASVQSGGDTAIKAADDVNIIGSDVAAKGNLAIEAEQGSVNVVTADVEKKVNGVAGTRMSQTDSTWQKQSSLSSGGDTSIKSGHDILVSGSRVKAGGDVALHAQDDVNITVAQQRTETIGSEVKQGAQTHVGSQIEAGGSVSVKAGDATDADDAHDIGIIGSKIDAKGKVGLSATDDVTITEARDTGYSQLDTSSKRIFSKKESHSRTETETAVGSSIDGGAGVDISSGNDTTISASRVQAGDENRAADLNVNAGGDLVIASGKSTVETDASKSKSGFLSKSSGKGHDYDETTVASELGASGSVNLNAGDNVAIAGSTVTAGENIAIEGDSVSVIGAQEAHDSSSSSKKSGLGAGSGDGFYSLFGKEEKSSKENIVQNAPSQLSAGNDVTIKARENDVNIVGSKVEAGNDIALDAARDVNILPGAESYASEDKEKRSGFGIQLSSGEGSASIGIGFGSSKDETRQGAETNAISSLKAGNDVVINAGRDANLQAALVEAERDAAITAERDVNLLSAQDVSNYEHMHEELFAGITATVSTGLVSAGKSIANAAEKISKVSDGYSAANAGFAGLKAADALEDLSAMANGKGNIASASIGVGFQYSKSKEEWESSVPVVTDIRGGNSVTIEAKSGDLNSHGAQIVAGYDENGLPTGGEGDISLKAGNDINLLSAQATNTSSSSSKSAGASVGVSVGLTLAGPQAGLTGSANYGSGKSNSNGTTQVNTHVTGTGDITLVSGRDTNLKGAVVSGETITANVGRDLNIISVPDTGESSNKSGSFGISVGGPLDFGSPLSGDMPSLVSQMGNMTPTGVSPGFGTGSGETNWISEQSGLISSGKMEVTVGGNTHLGAGKIVSDSGDLTLDTGTLTHENFSGSQRYEGFDIQANIDLTERDADGNKQQQPDQDSQPRTSAEGTYQLDDTRQEVRATVGPGEITIRDQREQTQLEADGKTDQLAALNRDPAKAYEVTKDKHVEIEYYISNTSLKSAANAVEIAGKTIGQAMAAMGSKLVESGDLTPQELETAKKVAKALDDGTLDLKQLVTCSGRQGFNLMDWIVGTAHASTGCSLFDNAGKKIADLTPQEREACIQLLSSLMQKYTNEYLLGNKGSGELPGSVRTIAEALRSIGSDEQLVAGAQALGMSASFIRDISIRLLLGKEGYQDFQREIEPLAAAGQLTKEAAVLAVEKIAAEQGLSAQDTKDLKLVAGVTTAAIIGAISAKMGLKSKISALSNVDEFLSSQISNMNSKLGKKIGQGRLPYPMNKNGVEQAKLTVRDTLENATSVSEIRPKDTLRGDHDLIHIYSEKTGSTVSLRILPGGKYEFDTLIPEKSSKVK